MARIKVGLRDCCLMWSDYVQEVEELKRVWGLRGTLPLRVENQMEKKMENEMEITILGRIVFRVEGLGFEG